MKLVIGSDHRGFSLKDVLQKRLTTYEVIDVGCYNKESCDYPVIAESLVNKINEDIEHSMGVIICGSGIGVSIAVNRYNEMRAALVYNKEVAKLSRNHNNANVICLPSDYITVEEALDFIDIFCTESFEEGRHSHRVNQLGCLGSNRRT